MGRFLCCWKCTNDLNDSTVEGESLREELEEEEESKYSTSFHVESEKERNKRAIALAAATAATADAAVAAAQAAVVVVRLTSKRSYWHDRYWAATKIQSAFRGYLARKALRALKALVKFQALIKGHLVRKQTALTLQSMQTLMRLQTTMQSKRSPPIFFYNDGKSQSISYPRRSLETQQMSSKSNSPKKTISKDACSSLPFSSPSPHPPMLKWQFFQESSVAANNTPRFVNNECSSPQCPNYMASTRSFDAKVRPQSTPKQGPEVA